MHPSSKSWLLSLSMPSRHAPSIFFEEIGQMLFIECFPSRISRGVKTQLKKFLTMKKLKPSTICFTIFFSCRTSIAFDSYAGRMQKAHRHVSVDKPLHLQPYEGFGYWIQVQVYQTDKFRTWPSTHLHQSNKSEAGVTHQSCPEKSGLCIPGLGGESPQYLFGFKV